MRQQLFPVACLFLVVGSTPALHAQTPDRVTFAKDVAPILFRECATCHHPGGSAAFSLLTFDQARQRARQMAVMTRARTMPPWKPEPGFGDFEGARRLSDQQIAIFQRWIDDGLQGGDSGYP